MFDVHASPRCTYPAQSGYDATMMLVVFEIDLQHRLTALLNNRIVIDVALFLENLGHTLFQV